MMFWRYLCFICLLGVPSSRTVSSASVGFASDPALDDELVDRIVYNLRGGENGEGIEKKDELVGADNSAGGTDVGGGGGDHQVGQGGEGNKEGLVQADSADAVSKDEVQNKEEEEVHEKLPEPSRQHQDGSSGDGSSSDSEDFIFLAIVGGCAIFGFIGLVGAGICYYKYRKSRKAATHVEYPAYGVTGPMKERVPSPGDRKLAQSAQMYHYQHQKQQMIAMEKANGDMKHDASDDDSEEDNVEGDYTVYECPGLAPTGEMEVKNPLFRGEETPVSPGGKESGGPNTPQGH